MPDDPTKEARRRALVARLLLAPLIAVIVCGAIASPWHSSTSVDNRTYLEMIQGVVRHGLPYTTNGPVEEFRDLQARWNYYSDGTLWGALSPIFPYLAAPFFALGGVRAVIRVNILVLALLALGAASLGRRLARDPLAGTATAYIALVSAPPWSIALDTTSYPTALAALAWSAALSVASLDATNGKTSRRIAAAAGFLGGLAIGCHILCFPIVAVLVAGLGILPVRRPDEDASSPDAPRLQRIGPFTFPFVSAQSVWRGVCALAGVAIPMLFVSAFNHLRFHSWNPLSYGPCAWHSCADTGLNHQNVREMLDFAKPVGVWATVAALSLWAVWRSRVARVVVIALAILALAPTTELRERALGIAQLAWGFLVDVSQLPMANGFTRHPDGLGNFFGPAAVKSLLQCTPLLAVAVLAPTRERSGPVWLIAWSCAAFMASLALRANLPLSYALGYPILNLRYVLPAIPLLAALAVVGMKQTDWHRAHAVIAAIAALVIAVYLLRGHDDDDHLRRVILLRVSLLLAAAAFVVCAQGGPGGWESLFRAARPWVLALAFGFGCGANMGGDLRWTVKLRNSGDEYLDRVARQTPPRFALVGWPPQIDPALALRATRDIEYLDLYESQDWGHFRTLVDRWTADGRPVFALFPPAWNVRNPWNDLVWTDVDPTLRLVRITGH